MKLIMQEREKEETARQKDLERLAKKKCEKKMQELMSQVSEVQKQRDLAKGEVSLLERKNKQLESQCREREAEVESMIILNGTLITEKV
jgi:chromosome segregation ATPase